MLTASAKSGTAHCVAVISIWTFIEGAAYEARYGDLVCNAAGRDSYFGALVVEVSDLAAMRARLDALASHADESVVRLMPSAHTQAVTRRPLPCC